MLFVARAAVRPRRVRQALAWVAAHQRSGRTRLCRAVSLCAFQGRFRARHALLGLRTPEDLFRHVRIVGEEHLRRSSGAMLLGFHLGPPAVGEAICAAGYHVTSIGGERHSRSWSSRAWAPIRAKAESLARSEMPSVFGGTLYRARRRLLDGDAIYITADGNGREAFAVLIPGGPTLSIKSGWLVLRRDCGVPVLPVVAHIEGSTQVITIHPPLPPVDLDRQRDLALCRNVLEALLARYVRDFPEQCCRLAFGD